MPKKVKISLKFFSSKIQTQISRGGRGGPGQFGKSSDLEFFFFWKASLSPFVHMCVCLSVSLCVCLLLRYRLNVFLPQISEVGCPIFLEIQNPWGKIMERSGLRFEYFSLEVV